MLSSEDNVDLSEVDRASAMGCLLRNYWYPVLLSSDLPEERSGPRRVRLLGEEFVAFRDDAGAVGILDEACCHRSASLNLARVEACGLKCIYHGWEYAVDGTIVSAPNVRGGRLSGRLRARSYPVREAGGLVWTYIGDGPAPDLPEFAFFDVPASQRCITRSELDCNWVQVVEAGLDSSHVGVLHADAAFFAIGSSPRSSDNCPTIDVEETDFGLHYAALRSIDQTDDAEVYARVHTFVMPSTTMVADRTGAAFVIFHVPHDSRTTAYVMCQWHPTDQLDPVELAERTGYGDPAYFRGDHFEGTIENGWLQDRSADSFSGFGGRLNVEDFAITVSQGKVANRSGEHLVAADAAIVRMRRLLLRSMRLDETAAVPYRLPGSAYRSIGVADGMLTPGTPWQSLVPAHRALNQSDRESREPT